MTLAPEPHAPVRESFLDGVREGWRNRPRSSFAHESVGMLRLLARMGRGLVDSIAHRRFPIEETVDQTWQTILVCTLPALAVSIPFGVVMALQVGVLAQQVGAVSFAGAGNSVAVIREAAPMIAALMLSGVAGSAICAELGARKIRDELDAMEVMGLSVVERIVVPRAIATVAVSVLLTGVVMFFTIMTTLLVSLILLGIAPGTYLASVSTLASTGDLWLSLAKAAAFGIICVTVAARKGLTVSSGPSGVGDAVTSSVVVNFVLLFAANFVISEIAQPFMTGPVG